MNDVTKTNIQTRLEKALNTEGISTASAGRILGVNPCYLSMMKKPEQWVKCPPVAWEAVLAWVNSGQKLNEFGEKHGKTVIDKPKHIELPPRVVDIKPVKDFKREELVKTKKEKPVVASVTLDYHNQMMAKAEKEIRALKEENTRLQGLSQPIKGTIELKDDCHKFPIDIEINLLLNGKKIVL